MDALYNAFDFLIHPTFWDPNNPPLKVNVNAKTMGLIAAILGGIGILFLLIAIPAVLAIGTVATGLAAISGVHTGGIFFLALIGLVLSLISTIMWTLGGWWMYNDRPEGRNLLVVALALSVVFSLLQNIGLGSATGVIGTLIINAIIYYFVMIARFPNEAPLATAAPPPSGPPTV